MEKLRILAKNLDEKNKIINLFIELGYKEDSFYTCDNNELMGIHVYEDGPIQDVLDDCYNDSNHKEITIQQLKDLVVLKRNDVGDATHENSHNQKLYKAENGWYIYIESHNAWMWNQEELGYKPIELKPIEKPMKEYLVKNENTGAYDLFRKYPDFSGEFDIEIPEGAEIYSYNQKDKMLSFYRNNGREFINDNYSKWLESRWTNDELIECEYVDILWQRDNNQTIASAIETLNDKVASAEGARQESKEWDLGDYAFAESDALIESNIEQAKHDHYYIDVSDVDEVDFYEIALRYNVTDPCIQHILKKCLAVGGRGHKDFYTDLKDIYDTASRALKIHKVDQ